MTESLFHYCSTESFHSIIGSGKIRLSSLSLSNDSLEGKLVAQSLQRLATAAGLNEQTRVKLLDNFGFTERTFEGLGFCLSEEGDLLSQWRGYANDGFGLSIGFSKSFLSKLSHQYMATADGKEEFGFALHQVIYDQDEHDTHVKPAFDEVIRLIADGVFSSAGVGLLSTEEKFEQIIKQQSFLLARLTKALFTLIPSLYRLKSGAFREEREWRLLSLIAWGITDDCQYGVTSNCLKPFREVKYRVTPNEPIITSVVLGPKHITPINVVEDFLKKSGFENVDVRRSDATYR